MQRKTKLAIDEFKGNTVKELNGEWTKLHGEAQEKGRFLSGAHIHFFLEIGSKYLKRFLDTLFESEKTILQGKQSEVKDDYFTTLTDEVTRMLSMEINTIQSKGLVFFGSQGHSSFLSGIDEMRKDTIDSIVRRVEMLQEDLEISPLWKGAVVETKSVDLPSFDFVQMPQVRSILKRDYGYITKCLEGECWKAAIVLCGSSIEAILYDLLKRHEEDAISAKKSQKDKQGTPIALEKWSLTALINTAVELCLISSGTQGLSHIVRDFRDAVHPAKEIDGSYRLERDEAENAFVILRMLIRDLSK